MPSAQDYIEAQNRYQGYRDAAYAMTWEVWHPLLPGGDIRILPFDENALFFCESAWHGARFPWRDIRDHYRKTPRRFEVALWSGHLLCALAVGRCSSGPSNVAIHFLERWFGARNPLGGNVAEIAAFTAENYAKILGKQQVRLKDPEPGLIPHYKSLGFTLVEDVGRSTYYGRAVE